MDSTGKCTVCKQQITNTSYTVTFYYLDSSLYSRSYSANVTANGYPSAPTVSSKLTSGGKTYTFVGWTQKYTSDHLYTNQALVVPSRVQITSNGYAFYALYATESDSTITYTVDAGEEESFNSKDFKKVHEAACSDTFEYVTFSVTSSTYNKFSGSVYSGKTELSASDLKSDFYYDEDDVGKNDYALDDLSLVAPKDAKDSSISISFTTYGTKNKTSTGTLKLEVGGSGDGTITYKVAPGESVDFSASDFNSAYKEMSGSSSSIRWVAFSATSAYTSFGGTLYCGSTSFSRSDLTYTKSTFYYSSSAYGDYDLDKVSFTADKDADDGDSLSLTFRAYRSDTDYETGTVKIVIDGDAVSGDITYEVAPGGKVDFDRTDFNKFFQKTYKNYTVSYVEFDKPSASAFVDGTLYYDYGGSSQASFTRTSLSGTKFYYSPSSKDYDLDELTFKADSDFEDDVTLTFTAYGSGSRSVDGTVVIRSTKKAGASGDITYKAAPGKEVAFDEDDFQAVYRKEYTGTIKWVEFTAPTALTSAGTIYYDYGYSSQKSFNRTTFNNTKFYYGTASSYGEYALDDLSFVASSSFSTAVSVSFQAYYSDTKYVEGTMILQPDTAAAASSTYVGSIRYATTTGTRVQINANDIARYFKKNTGAAMQYVMLTGVPSAGSLYYNYYNTSKYGTTARAQITASNASGQAFYASPANTSQFALTELTYVPSGTNYCAAIPFTAYGSSRSVTGAILISVNSSTVAEVYGVTPKNTAVTFPASSISSAVVKATGTTPASIQLLSLPSYTAGTVYVGTGTTTAANTTTAYSIFSGAQSLRFVPSSSYTGSVEIPYVALNSNGVAIASGTFSLGVLNSKKTFSDVTTSTWCYKYVAELSDASVIDGYSNGTFKPDSTVTYGAALKLIMLAAGYPEQKPTGSNVFSGYLAKAREDGIITVSTVNLSKPITRLQVAQLAAGAMKLDTTNLSSVKPFTD
ncbi:MAG: S-layer homology domain-containing protein, partial [Oscillospiraceae bacterium]|nr:S-layer homology domain-containing protein [Oscillospiraceae bacterium]